VTAVLHAAAILDRLGSHGASALTVFDGRVDDSATPPYLLVRCSLQWLGADARPDAVNLAGTVKAATCTARIYAVGKNEAAARILFDRMTAALLNWRPTIVGRSCTPMRHDSSFETPADERTGIAYHELGAIWEFTSHPV
jgi:hypothetical protein